MSPPIQTQHVSVNGKRNVAIDFAVIQARLDARRRGLRTCPCGAEAVEVLHHWHPNVPATGICARHLESWKREQLLALSP